MLLPIGLNAYSVDELFVAEMNDFGSKRGNAAHQSLKSHVSTGVNPLDEAAQVKRILSGLRPLDIKIDELVAAAKGN